MTKQDFLEGLRRHLSGSLDYRQVNEHLNYYAQYIDSQIRQGKSEAQVMEELGDPRLIAKTLTGIDGGEGFRVEYREEYIEDEERVNPNDRYVNFNGKVLRIPGWLFTILICLLLFCILTVVFTLITNLLPFIGLILLFVFAYRFFRSIF